MQNHPLVAGILGTTASFSGFVISFLPMLETGLRLASLIVGIVAGLLTIYFQIKNRK